MPKGWFGPKTFGYGASPASWQGWLISLAVVGGIVASMHYRAALAALTGSRWATVVSIAVLTLAYLVIIAATYSDDA